MTKFRRPLVIPTDERILAYTAGILDGEGCIRIKEAKRQKRSIYAMSVCVGNTNEQVLEFLLNTFGGSIQPTRRKKTKSFAMWEISGIQAAEFLLALIPFLIVKRAQAIVAIRFGATKQAQRIGVTPSAVVEFQRHLKAEMHTLNARWKPSSKAVGE